MLLKWLCRLTDFKQFLLVVLNLFPRQNGKEIRLAKLKAIKMLIERESGERFFTANVHSRFTIAMCTFISVVPAAWPEDPGSNPARVLISFLGKS
jgi:hypothetical protein